MSALRLNECLVAIDDLRLFVRKGFDIHGHCEVCGFEIIEGSQREPHEDWCPYVPLRDILRKAWAVGWERR